MSMLRSAFTLLLLMTALLGGLYPACVWLFGQTLFHDQANGSLIYDRGHVVGSSLIGQSFTSPKYFHGRPSGTHGEPYQFLASGASNLSAANPLLIETVRARALSFKRTENVESPAPVELVTSSGSGLDPHISLTAAYVQANRIAKVRGLSVQAVLDQIDRHVEQPSFGFLGEHRVNVLNLNLELDHSKTEATR